MAQAYYAPHVESQEEIVDRVSREMDFDQQIVKNVIDAETGGTWDCSLKGKDGEVGCLQIIPKFHPEVDPTDFEASVRYFISEHQAGRGWQWTGCSCVQSARLTVPNLPKGDAGSFKPNTTMDRGKIAILDYDGVRHVTAYKVTPTGLLALLEGNFEPCVIEDRLILWEEVNKHLVGFYAPTSY